MGRKYDLTQAEFNRSLKMAEMAIFMNSKKSNRPTSVFVVGQPGAGKTGLRSYIENEYQKSDLEGQFIEFDPDMVAIYHKYYNEILAEFPKESYKMLQKFVLPALDNHLRYKAVQLRNNIMQEGTFAATQGYERILEFQKNGGTLPFDEEQKVDGNYFIDINVIAVHKLESLLSSYEREQYFIESGLPPRVVTEENHDRAYNNILKTLDLVEQKGLYSRIRLFRRGELENNPKLVYELGESTYPNSSQALIAEREKNKKEILQQPEKYLTRIENLRQKISKNKTNTDIQLERLNKLQEDFSDLLEQNKTER